MELVDTQSYIKLEYIHMICEDIYIFIFALVKISGKPPSRVRQTCT